MKNSYNSSMIKTLNIVYIEGYIIKAIFENPMADSILKVEKLKTFPLRSIIRQGCPLSSLLFNIVLEIVGTAAIAGKESKSERSK